MGKAVLSEPKAHCATSLLALVPRGINRVRKGRGLVAPLIARTSQEQQLVLRGIHPDLIELAPPPGRETIGISAVREVIRQGQFAPVQGERKVCLIAHAEALTLDAANALLKVLEEPPRDLMFLLLAAHTGDILPTILSRSQVVRLAPPVPQDLLARIIAVGYSEEEGKYLLGVARKEDELERFLATKEDLTAMRTQAKEKVCEAAAESLMVALTADDPILRYEGVLVLLNRLINGDAELAVTGTRVLAQGKREKVTTLLEDLHTVAFDVVRASLSLPISYHHAILSALAEGVKTEQVLKYCQKVERAQQAVEGYVLLEAVLLSLFLDARRLRDG